MPTWLKWTIVSTIVLLVLLVSTGVILHKTDSKFRYWWSLPIENRLLSINLEVVRPINHYILDKLDSEKYEYIGKDSLISSVALGAQWIVNMQEESGRFNYWYNPDKNRFSSKSEDNFLRQAGTNYSLLSAFEVLGDTTLLNAAQLNLSYLNQFLVDTDPDTAYYMYKRKVKLGGIALPMLVMLKLRNLRKDSSYDNRLRSLSNMIIGLQDRYGESGQFKSTYIYQGSYNYEKETNWESNIYPGEAMLALAEMYEAFKEPRYLQSLEKALTYYSNDGNWRHFSFMPWATIAMSKIAIITGNEKFADFAYLMTDRILYWQNIDPDKQVVGSLFGVPTVFTSTWMEGVGAALELAVRFKHEKRAQTYRKQLLLSFNWLLQLQYSIDDLGKFGFSTPALGGFKRSLIEPEIRIDNTQHAISALIRGINYY